MTAQFHIHGTLPHLNKVIADVKQHWSLYSNTKRHATDKVCLLARSTWRSRPPIEHPVVVTFTWHLVPKKKNRAMDPDNVSHGQKYILDGLVKAGVLVDDSPAQVLALHHEFRYDTKDPYVTVTLKEAG